MPRTAVRPAARSPRALTAEAARHEVVETLASLAPSADLDTIGTDEPIWDSFGLEVGDIEEFADALASHTGIPISPDDYARLESLDAATAFLVVASRTRPPV